MNSNGRYLANPNIVLRIEFDDWGILFDPETGKSKGINPTGILIWQKLDGTKSKEQILSELAEECEDGVPDSASEDFDSFISSLRDFGYVSL